MDEKQVNKKNVKYIAEIYSLLPNVSLQNIIRLDTIFSENREYFKESILDLKKKFSLLDENYRDDLISLVLVGDITIFAGLELSVVMSNKLSISRFCKRFNISQENESLLLDTYADISSALDFDEEFSSTIKKQSAELTEEQKYKESLNVLISNAHNIVKSNIGIAQKNQEYIEQLFNDNKFPFAFISKYKNKLTGIYEKRASKNFEIIFNDLVEQLIKVNDKEQLCYVLAVKLLAREITLEDATNVAKLDNALMYNILVDDLIAISQKYFQTKKIDEIVDTIEAVLDRLDYNHFKEENLGLAIKVLIEGTYNSLNFAQQNARRRRFKDNFKKQLNKYFVFQPYLHELSDMFFGYKTATAIISEFKNIMLALSSYKLGLKDRNKIAVDILCKRIDINSVTNDTT